MRSASAQAFGVERLMPASGAMGGASPQFTTGEYNGNLGPEDDTIWANNFGLSVSAPSSSPSAAPEPSTLVLLLIAGIYLIAGGRAAGANH